MSVETWKIGDWIAYAQGKHGFIRQWGKPGKSGRYIICSRKQAIEFAPYGVVGLIMQYEPLLRHTIVWAEITGCVKIPQPFETMGTTCMLYFPDYNYAELLAAQNG